MPSSPSLTAFTDAVLFTGEAMVEGHALLIKDDEVADIVAQRQIPPDAAKISCAGQILAPGFIDAQVNGGGNALLNDNPTPERCMAIAEAHRAYGTTRLLLTCITDRPEVMMQAITSIRAARKKDPGILGVHIEGPHLGSERRGIHKAEYVRSLGDIDLQLYRRENDEVILMTVAPETVLPEQIATLRRQGMTVSLGHTSATAEQTRAALAAGATGFTHLFNGMESMSSRNPGVAGVALDDAESWCGLIADGHHVSPEMIRLAWRAKPQGKVFLVSDAMPPSATKSPREFSLYGETIRVENGRCINAEGKLAGASITMLDAVRYCTDKVGLELEEVLRMASTYPAAFLGIGARYGKLLPGYRADIIMLTPRLDQKGVWTNGAAFMSDIKRQY